MAKQRRRYNQKVTLKDRLQLWAEKVRRDAEQLPRGPAREVLLKKARQADTRAHLGEWANSKGLQPPK